MTQTAHFNMVEQQIRPWNVHSPSVIDAITTLDRSCFVPQGKQALCCMDVRIALIGNRRMLEPKVAARMVQTLDIKADDRVLVVGAGSGYTAALCAKLAYQVVCVSRNQKSLDQAQKNCQAAGISNISFIQNEALRNDTQAQEFDAILLRTSLSAAPVAYFKQLAVNGRCVARVGDGCVFELIRYEMHSGKIQKTSLLELLSETPVSRKNEFIF